METPVHDITAPSVVYEVGGRRFEITAHGFADAIADAHESHLRPRCMCLVEGLDMYVARLGNGYIVKRMPDTGSHHAPGCPSYEPPAEFPGLVQLLGSAITEDPATGETTLKLGFPLSKIPGRRQMPPSAPDNDSVATDGTKLSLRGLLHYLWDQAELTRWHPGFTGKRSWATVRMHLLQAADHKIARGQALQSRLYIPEVFSVERRDAINARRFAQLAHAVESAGRPQQLMLMIAEVKEIVPARYGYKAIVKHVPDQAFAVDGLLYRRLGRHFEAELAMWGASDTLRMVMIATFKLSGAGLPIILELSLMPVTAQWLPVESTFELQLIDTLIREGRAFVRGLRYGLAPAQLVASAMLTDTGTSPCPLCIHSQPRDGTNEDSMLGEWPSAWIWKTHFGEMPALPVKQPLKSSPTVSTKATISDR